MQLVNRDQLAEMRDEELFNIQNIFRRKLQKAYRDNANNESKIQIETELNYIFREMQIREDRRRAHLEYMNSRANKSRVSQ